MSENAISIPFVTDGRMYKSYVPKKDIMFFEHGGTMYGMSNHNGEELLLGRDSTIYLYHTLYSKEQLEKIKPTEVVALYKVTSFFSMTPSCIIIHSGRKIIIEGAVSGSAFSRYQYEGENLLHSDKKWRNVSPTIDLESELSMGTISYTTGAQVIPIYTISPIAHPAMGKELDFHDEFGFSVGITPTSNFLSVISSIISGPLDEKMVVTIDGVEEQYKTIIPLPKAGHRCIEAVIVFPMNILVFMTGAVNIEVVSLATPSNSFDVYDAKLLYLDKSMAALFGVATDTQNEGTFGHRIGNFYSETGGDLGICFTNTNDPINYVDPHREKSAITVYQQYMGKDTLYGPIVKTVFDDQISVKKIFHKVNTDDNKS